MQLRDAMIIIIHIVLALRDAKIVFGFSRIPDSVLENAILKLTACKVILGVSL